MAVPGLVTYRFTTAANIRPALGSPEAVVDLQRLFQIEDHTPSWLAWYETPACIAPAEIFGWPPNAADCEAMTFVLKRDVRNADHQPSDIGWLYVVHTDVPDDVATEYNAWYDEEHLPRLAKVPGVVRARRYVSPDAHPRYFTAYDLADRDAFTSPEGLKARKTPWTARMRDLFSNTRRFTGQLISV